MAKDTSDYGLSKQVDLGTVHAPAVDYLPRLPKNYRPKIGLVGAGGVTEYHLRAYQQLGLEVAAICDVDLARARKRRDEFYPNATLCSDFKEIVQRPDLEVIDAALHPENRVEVIQAALSAGKHVLSQKPLALDVELAQRLADLADQNGVRLAVNQNGRWAPHFAYARAVVEAGLLGNLSCVDFNLAFDHSWTIGTPFENIHHLILYDFGVHWFDLASCFLGARRVKSVYASVTRASYQKARPPFIATALIQSDDMQVRISFNATVTFGQVDRTVIAGSLGTLESIGPSLSDQKVKISTAAGIAEPALTGTWFTNGFQGTMCELLCAIAEKREPRHSARNNLRTLELCFAAIASADSAKPVQPGTVRSLPKQGS